MPKTLITYLVEQGQSKDKAERVIRSGQVMINDVVVFTPSEPLKDTDRILIKKTKEWVSRGAYKLLKAIDVFNLDIKDKAVLDIGSSTGGFTQVALENGALQVNSVDVGTNQLDYKLRVDPRVNVFEKTNLKTITPEMFDRKIELVIVDVSFISLRHVFNVSKALGDKDLQIMALIKPQFEANSNQVQPGGIVLKELHQEIIDKVKGYAEANGFILKEVQASPITGNKSKNIEYISLFERNNNE